MKKIFFALLAWVGAATAFAQSGTNSPYSQFGLGTLADQSTGFNRGMNGVGIGFRDHNQVNPLNPASYSSIDSLTFIFDAGVSGQVTNFKEGNKKVNANNANFEYVVAALRLVRHLGLSFGILPFTNVGYSYKSTGYVSDMKTATYTNTYNGSGGFHELYVGLGWEPIRGLSIGVNGAYLWGNYTKSLANNYSETYASTLSKYYTAEVRNYKLDFGVQYNAKLSKKDNLTIGLTYSPGHKIGGDAKCQVIMNNVQTSVTDTTNYPKDKGLDLELPTMMGAGLAYSHAGKLKVGIDYTLQQWSKTTSPVYTEIGGEPAYVLKSNLFKDRHKVALGADYCPAPAGRHFLRRIHYRAGISYATPYIKIDGKDGPKEISATVGFGIPIMNAWNDRSTLNISAGWSRQEAKGFITENTFRINIGLTFNERWFAKWKVK